MAIVEHAALDPVQAVPDTASLETRRKTAARDDEYLFEAAARNHRRFSSDSPANAQK